MFRLTDGEGVLHVGSRAVARVDLDHSRLHDELAAVVVEAEVALVERERDRLRLALAERDALEAAQPPNRLRDARDRVVDVQLGHVVTRTVARVGDSHARGERSVPAYAVPAQR